MRCLPILDCHRRKRFLIGGHNDCEMFKNVSAQEIAETEKEMTF